MLHMTSLITCTSYWESQINASLLDSLAFIWDSSMESNGKSILKKKRKKREGLHLHHIIKRLVFKRADFEILNLKGWSLIWVVFFHSSTVQVQPRSSTMSRKGDLTHTHKMYKLHTAQHNCSTSNISTISCLTCFILMQHEGTIMSNNTPKTHSRSLHWNQPHTHHSHQAVPPCHVTGPGWGSCDVASTVAEQTGAWLC